jgi:hypothetical protein
MPSSQPTRAELLGAREQLERQIYSLKYPSNWWDRNPELLARLEAILSEVTTELAEEE